MYQVCRGCFSANLTYSTGATNESGRSHPREHRGREGADRRHEGRGRGQGVGRRRRHREGSGPRDRGQGVRRQARPVEQEEGRDARTIKERFGGYLGVEDKAVRKARIAQVQQIVDHFGVGKASELDEANWQEALDFLTAFENGEEPDFGDGDGEGDGDESLV